MILVLLTMGFMYLVNGSVWEEGVKVSSGMSGIMDVPSTFVDVLYYGVFVYGKVFIKGDMELRLELLFCEYRVLEEIFGVLVDQNFID